jgi:hypothetical protein
MNPWTTPSGSLSGSQARHPQHDRDARGDRLILDHLRPAHDPTGATVQVLEHRRRTIPLGSVEDPGCLQDGVHRGGRQGLVLGREGVDARWDDRHAVAIKPFPAVGGPGEHIGVGRLHIGAQELPRRPGQVVGLVNADMTAPDHRRPQPLQLRSKPDGLWVVQHHHVAGADPWLQLGERLLLDLVVDPSDALVQVPSVSWPAVEQVVEALGRLESVEFTCHKRRPASRSAAWSNRRAKRRDGSGSSTPWNRPGSS